MAGSRAAARAGVLVRCGWPGLLVWIVALVGCGANGGFGGAGAVGGDDRVGHSMKAGADERFAELNDSIWDFRDAAGSERRFREAAAGEGDESVRLRLLTQVARAQGLQRRFEEAHATLDGVGGVVGRRPGGGARGVVFPLYALERGRVFNSSGDRERARAHFREAWDSANAAGQDAVAVDAAHMLAIVSSGGDAVAWNVRALGLAESSGDERARRWRASLHNNLGWTFHDQGEYGRALDHFRSALSAREERGQVRETLIARWAVARCLRSLGRVEEALSWQRELVSEWETVGERDGYVFEEIGECLLLLGQAERARPYFARAHELLGDDPWLRANEPERLERLAELGGVGPPG